jgi:nucleoside-diphosphate-sugar epimerase
MSIMTIKLAVTGASGFVGRHVIRALLKTSVQITAVSRSAARLSEFSDRVRILEVDLANPGERLFERLGSPEVLIHLGWDGLPNYNLLQHFEVELPNQYSLLKGLIAGGLKSLVVSGTCFEYGLQSGPLAETAACQPSNPYGYAKHALHQQLRFLQSSMPFQLTWARLFYMFGEGQAETSLWSLLNRALDRGDAFFPMSGGEQLRDYLPVSVVADHLVRLAMIQQNIGAVNVCSGSPVSVRNLVEDWTRQRGAIIRLDLGRYPYPDYEPMAFWGEGRKLNTIMDPHENHARPL